MSLQAMLWAVELAPTEDAAQTLVLIALADSAEADGSNARPAVSTIASRARMSDRTVQRRLRELEALGMISIEKPSTRDTPTQWRLHMDRIRRDLDPELLRRSVRNLALLGFDFSEVELPQVSRGDKVTPPVIHRGDEGGSDDTDCHLGGDTDDTPRGDTAMSPEQSFSQSSYNPSSLPAVGEVQDRRDDAPSDLRPGNEDHSTPPAGNQANAPTSPLAAVWQALPEELRGRIGGSAQGKVIDAIRAELAAGTRTPAQLVERVGRRWARWQALGEQVGNPVKLAITLVQPRKCPAVECEDGTLLDSGERCAACADSKPQRPRPNPSPTPAAAAPAAGVEPMPNPRPEGKTLAEAVKIPDAPWATMEPPARPTAVPAPRKPSASREAVLAATRAKLGTAKHTNPFQTAREIADTVGCPRCQVLPESLCCDPDTGEELPVTRLHSQRVMAFNEQRQALARESAELETGERAALPLGAESEPAEHAV
ncbi:helix-turn-helix domain-containing protein (plasmid) [Microtetraspora malaysiensis]|uniref:helix-turn-helix domain-containing protein n=1 Tax=Microtetraspora malaysiensis TaxID=161358 RepID=UPI003D906995